ncbi:MAG: hypothetical protein LWW86_09185 [Micrococcales bacterium]|nr:hypothetical protein [Micrococcales bacterium]
MPRYEGRHAAKHASPGFSRTAALGGALGGALRRPVVASSVGAATVCLSVAGYAASAQADAPALEITAAGQAAARSAAILASREAANDQAERGSAVTGKAIADQKARVAAAKAAAEKKAAEERARKAAAEKAAAERKAAADKAARDKERASVAAAKASALASAQSDPKAAAKSLLADHGWGEDQFSCLNSLWMKESGWNFRATNPSSGAYGIPQSLPGSKMATFGSDWQTNPVTQIKWGLDYIKGRYGTPCAAWGHSQSVNWY